jgi:hypothetical protein
LRSYDPQIGRFLQNDPYDEFASGYVGMGNDPANLTDPSGGCSTCWWLKATVENFSTLQPVTVIATKKLLLTTAKVGSITAKGQNIGTQIIKQAFKKPSFFARAWSFLKAVGPSIGRGASVIGGLLIPISTGEGASLTPQQRNEMITNDPSSLPDEYLRKAEDRLNSGQGNANDWRLRDEIQRRKTARENVGGDFGSPAMPKYENPGHHDPNGGENPYDPNKSVLPENHEELWKRSVPDPKKGDTRWTKEGDKNPTYHRFQDDGNGNWHWNGSTKGKTKNNKDRKISINDIPVEIKRN